MKKSILLLTFLFSIGLISCEKQRDRVAFGRIIYSDDKKPVQYTGFKLTVVETTMSVLGSQNKEVDYPLTTDENGFFKVLFQAKSDEFVFIRHPSKYKEVWYGDVRKKTMEVDAGTIEIEK